MNPPTILEGPRAVKNFRITDGDLDLSHSNRVDMVLGRDKLTQDLTLWLLEPLGTGYATPGFGSTLNTVVSRDTRGRREGRFIGQEYTEDVAVEIETEVDRVLNLYQQDQVQKIRQAKAEGRLYLYSKREILNSIDSITSNQDRDTAVIKVDITTGANQELDLLAQVDTEEVQISAS